MFRKRDKDAPLVYADPRQERQRKMPDLRRVRNGLVALAVVLGLLAAGVVLWMTLHGNEKDYNRALELLARKDYAAAEAAFDALDNYRDSRARAEELRGLKAAYAGAVSLADQQRYDEAVSAFRALGDYADSAEQAAFRVPYRKALDLLTEIDNGQTRLLGSILSADARLTDENGYPIAVGYETAAALFAGLGDYADAPEMVQRCILSAARVKLGWQDWEGALACREKMDERTAAQFDEEYQAAQAAAENEQEIVV